MSANLHSILGDEVILPRDLLPDDTTLIYDKNGNPVDEKDFDDPDDENLANSREINRYSDLALAYYNGKHHTDYKFVDCTHLEGTYGDSILIHFGFTASPSTASEKCEYAAAKQFCAKLEAQGCSVGEEAVTSCCIVDGPKVCEDCYDAMRVYSRNVGKTSWDEELNRTESMHVYSRNVGKTSWDQELNRTESKEIVPPLSKYSHLLADGVTLSDKAKLRLRFILLALAYYNKKQHADYKLVDGLPCCFSCETNYGIVYHCNFIARQNKSDKLFFAELKKPDDDWVVTSCRVVRGKTTAGCHVCPSHLGKRVIHPTRGFRFGLYPEGCRSSCRGRR